MPPPKDAMSEPSNATWQDAATAERIARVKTERTLSQARPAPDHEAWSKLGTFFKFWVGSSLHDASGVEIDLEEPYEAFRTLYALRPAVQTGDET